MASADTQEHYAQKQTTTTPTSPFKPYPQYPASPTSGITDEQKKVEALTGIKAEEEFQLGFGADNAAYNQQEFGVETFGGMVWQEMLAQSLPKELSLWAKQNDQDPDPYVAWFHSQFSGQMLPFVTNQMYFMFADLPGSAGGGGAAQEQWANSPQGLATIKTWAWDFMGMKVPQLQRPRPSGGGGGGGTGPSAADIRAQFDIDELTSRANEVWQSFLLEDDQDARAKAKAYVEAIVRNPKQKLDFDTFIENQARNTGRWASIYRSLPDGMDPRQYMQPYYQSALQFARPEEAAGLAIGGAQFGSDPAAFRSRLGRTDAVTGSAPFIQGLEGRLASLSNVLRG